ncbi:MAG: YihY/virulence factor BrkB family protein [Acutalibacteraceae bacterium]
MTAPVKNPKLRGIFRSAVGFFEKCAENHIPAYSAQSSFFIVISMVPFAMLFFSVLRLFIPVEREIMIEATENIFPAGMLDFTEKIIDELYANVSFSVISVTTIVLLWSASKGIKSMTAGLQNVYKTTRPTDFIFNIIFSILYTVIFIAILIITVIVLIFGRRLNDLLFAELPVVRSIIAGVLEFRSVLFLLPLTLFFALSYKFLAKNDLKFSAHLPGAILCALGWMLFSLFFAIYVDNFANYSYIYGSLTAVILLMLWLYACMTMFLIGAQINVVLKDRRRSKIAADTRDQGEKQG